MPTIRFRRTFPITAWSALEQAAETKKCSVPVFIQSEVRDAFSHMETCAPCAQVDVSPKTIDVDIVVSEKVYNNIMCVAQKYFLGVGDAIELVVLKRFVEPTSSGQ